MIQQSSEEYNRKRKIHTFHEPLPTPVHRECDGFGNIKTRTPSLLLHRQNPIICIHGVPIEIMDLPL